MNYAPAQSLNIIGSAKIRTSNDSIVGCYRCPLPSLLRYYCRHVDMSTCPPLTTGFFSILNPSTSVAYLDSLLLKRRLLMVAFYAAQRMISAFLEQPTMGYIDIFVVILIIGGPSVCHVACRMSKQIAINSMIAAHFSAIVIL